MAVERRDVRVFAIIAVVALMFIAAGVIVAVATTNDATDSTPLVLSLFGMIGTTLAALTAAFFSERVSHDVRNRVLEDKVEKGVIAGYPKAVDELAAKHFGRESTPGEHRTQGKDTEDER